MYRMLLVVVLALSAIPAALAQNDSSASSPAQRCAAQRTAIGTAAFNQLYGTNANDRNAFGKCVTKLARSDKQQQSGASQTCRTEQDDPNFAANHGGKTFAEFYGTNKKGKNAFGRCVSQRTQAEAQTQQVATINAARACKAERTADPTAFKNRYGTNKNKSNAFGKCVSLKAKQG